MSAKPWNHNIQYFPFIEREVAREPRRSALDIGSGDGMLAARLARIVPAVVGLDLHEAQVDAASRTWAHVPGLTFETGDLLTAHPAGAPFDAVTCSATLHHVDLVTHLGDEAVGPTAGGLAEVRRVVELLLGLQLPEWSDERVAVVGTGRASPTDAERAALTGARLPVFS